MCKISSGGLLIRGIISLLILFCIPVQGQQQINRSEKLVQVSGIISTRNNTPIPFSTIRIKNTFRGTIAGVDGFYSMVAAEKDTIEYVALGFKKLIFIVPQNPEDQKVFHSVSLENDTITYEETIIYPWPTKEEFKQAFINLNLKDNYYDIAKKNLDQRKLAELYESLARDGKESQIYTLQQIASSYYYAGGQTNFALVGNGGVPIPTSLLNPFAWTQFVKAIQEGKFKRKKD